MIFRKIENRRIDKKTFMIFGSFSGSNAGDTAVLESLMAQLNLLFPKSKFYVPTTVPLLFSTNECLQDYDIEPISMRRWDFAHGFFSPQLLNKIIRCDAVFTTANMFFDRHLFSPYANLIFSLLPVLLFYRMLRWKGKVIAASVSVTPPTSLLGKIILKRVLELHHMVALRDLNSELVVAKLSKKIQFVGNYPDMVIGKDVENDAIGRIPSIKRDGKKLIGINLSSYFKGELLVPGTDILSGWIKFFTNVTSALQSRKENEVIFIMTSSTNEAIADEISLIFGRRIKVFGPSVYNYKEIHHLISQVDVYLSMRMHGAIFAFSAGVPCIGLCFTDKLRQFYSDYSLEEYMMDIRSTDYNSKILLERLLDKIQGCANLPTYKKQTLKTEMSKYSKRQNELSRLISNVLL